MTSRIRKSFFVIFAFVFLFAFTGNSANAQCGTRGNRPCLTKRQKTAAAKRRAARAKLRHKRKMSSRQVRYVREIPPRDPNRYTIVGYSTATDYRGPVRGDTYTVAPGAYDSTKPGNPISGGVLNGKARALPLPAYPAAARAVRAGGPVGVKVLIDENGDVIEAIAVSGNPLLRAASVAAARGAKFSPTRLEGRPVKVAGIITYNYVP